MIGEGDIIGMMKDRSRPFWVRSALLALLWFTFPLRASVKTVATIWRWVSADRFYRPCIFVVGLLLPLLFWLAPLGLWYMDKRDGQEPHHAG